MRKFEQKKSFIGVISSPFVLVVLFIILIFLAKGAWNIYEKVQISEGGLVISEARLSRLQSRYNELASSTERLKTETGIEGEIRDKLHMAKPGEKAIVIVDEPNKKTNPQTAGPNFLQKVWSFFTR